MTDKLLFTDEQAPLAEDVLDILLHTFIFDSSNQLLICIGGKSGTGKTEVSILVSDKLKKLGVYTKILHLDTFYLPHHEQKRIDTNFVSVGYKEIDWNRLKRSIGNIQNTHAYHMIIVEGLYSNHITKDYGFYISQSYDDSYNFRVKRGKENPDCNDRKKVLDLEAGCVRDTKYKADHILTYKER